MKSVRLLLGTSSNNRNTYEPFFECGSPEGPVAGAMLSLAGQEEYDHVVLAGGEPTLRRDLPRIVAAAKGLGLGVSLWTNGRIFAYRKAVDVYVESGLDALTVGLCGESAEVHDAAVGNEAFKQTVEGIKNAVAAGLDVSVDIPVCSANAGHVVRTGLLAAGLGVRSICFRLVEAGSVENMDKVPDLKPAAAETAQAVAAIDELNSGVVCGYTDFPCCLLATLRGREFTAPRMFDMALFDEKFGSGPKGIRMFDALDPTRSLPVPCVSCELRRGCSTLESSFVLSRGSGDLFLPVQSHDEVVFRPSRILDEPVMKDGKCPWMEGPISEVPSVETLFLVRDGRTEQWKLSSGFHDASTLMHAKNIRANLVLDTDGRIPRLHKTCFDCENLSRCSAVFEVDDACERLESMPATTVTSDAGTADYLTWPDFSAGFERFLAASGDSAVHFEGGVSPIRLVDEEKAEPCIKIGSPVEPVILWEGIRKAARCELVDYNLPYGHPRFSLDVKASDSYAQVDKMGTLLVIRKCTMNCIICQIQKVYEGIDVMPLPDVVRFLEEFRLLGFTRLDLFGGEPTLRKDLTDLVYFGHRMGFFTDLVTNGTLMDDELATGLRDSGLDLCIVSLDGPTPEIHDKIRRVKDGHCRAVAGIKAAVRAGDMEVNVDTVVLPENVDHLIDLTRQVSELGVTRVNLFLCLEGPISSPVPRLLGYEKTCDLYERIIPGMRRIGKPKGTSISVGPRVLTGGRPMSEVVKTRMFKDIAEGTYNVTYRHPEILCKAPDDEIYISLFGDVFPCTAPQLLETDANMGNAYRNKLIEILRSEKWDAFRKIAGHHSGCRMCWRAHFDLDRDGEERILDIE